MIQDLTDDRLFSFEVNGDPSLLGDHWLTVEVKLDDYFPEVYNLYVPMLVSVRCTNPALIETWTIPPAWNPNEYDESHTSSLPIYESCFLPYTNLSY